MSNTVSVTEYLGKHKIVNETRPLVSVCVTAYQHAEYIEKCLDSILSQSTDFDFEVLLGEDESSDGTRAICKKIAGEHTEKIRLFLHNRRKNYTISGKPSGKNNFLCNVSQARGKYLAFCDGDDFWTSDLKLQRQVNAMVAQRALIGFHSAMAQDELTGHETRIGNFGATDRYVAVHEILPCFSSAMPMHAIMINASLKNEVLEYGYEVAGMHGFLQTLGACVGGGASYIAEPLGIYRTRTASSVMANAVNTGEVKLEWTKRTQKMLKLVDYLSTNRYSSELQLCAIKTGWGALGSGYLGMNVAQEIISYPFFKGMHRTVPYSTLRFLKNRPKFLALALVRKARARAKCAKA